MNKKPRQWITTEARPIRIMVAVDGMGNWFALGTGFYDDEHNAAVASDLVLDRRDEKLANPDMHLFVVEAKLPLVGRFIAEGEVRKWEKKG